MARKSLRRQLAELTASQEEIRQRIYEACAGRDVSFDVCWRAMGETMGGAYTQDHYLALDSGIATLESEAVSTGKAYRGMFGNLIWL